MWPSQRLDTERDVEISQCASEILHIATTIIKAGNYHLRSIVFPLFLAGVFSDDPIEKQLALDLITEMAAKGGIGRNADAARYLLGVLYERQNEHVLVQGHSLDVDWMGVMAELGLQVVNFGM